MMMHDKPYGKMSKEDQKYYAEMDVKTLVDANEVRKDKPRLKRAAALARKQSQALEGLV